MQFFNKFLLLLISLLLINTLQVFATSESDMIRSVLKIKVYGVQPMSGDYVFMQWGSAVAIDSKRILTNAHVVLFEDGTPTGLYEICRSEGGDKEPVCFTTAKLISYDSVTDLALLELSDVLPKKQSLVFSDKSVSIGTNTIVYGYPAIGGSTITRTEGKIGGKNGDNYKFDGTIDSGNSGGGAFDSSGKLIGIPYALSSENGVIGYIISNSVIKKFIDGKAENIIKNEQKVASEFKTYIKNVQSLSKNINSVSTKYVTIKDLGKAGFRLSSATQSKDESIFDYRFSDKTNRVVMFVSCAKDALNSKKSLEDIINDQNTWLSNEYSELTVHKNEKNKDVLTTSFTDTTSKGEQTYVVGVYNMNAKNCSITIIATDKKKDKSIYTKALDIAKKIEFPKTLPVTKTFSSSFFIAKTLPDYLYLSEGTSLQDVTILPSVQTIYGADFITDSRLEFIKLDSTRDYFEIVQDDFRGKIFTFNAWIDAIKSENDDTKVVTTKSQNKKNIILLYTEEKNDDGDTLQTEILVWYPFKKDTIYGLYQFKFEYEGKNTAFEEDIRAFFETIELPGVTPFKA